MAVTKPTFQVIFDGRDINELLGGQQFQSLSIKENLEGESDSMELVVVSPDRRWLTDLYPKPGQLFEVKFGYEDGEMSESKTFEVDSLKSNLINKLTISGSSTPPSKQLRSRNSKAWENTNLREIFQDIASKNDLELVGEIPSVEYKRKDQNNKTDLEFLRNLASEHNLIVKVEDTDKLVVHNEDDLESQDAAIEITLEDMLLEPSHREKLEDVASSVRVKGTNADTGENIVHTARTNKIENGQSMDITKQDLEDKEQAKKIGESSLKKKNKDKFTLDFSVPGSPQWQAGVNFQLTDAGPVFDGKYQVKSVSHRLNNSGYQTKISSRKILDLEIEEALVADILSPVAASAFDIEGLDLLGNG
jgi:hypothetical protein